MVRVLKKPTSLFNPGLMLITFWITGPWSILTLLFMEGRRLVKFCQCSLNPSLNWICEHPTHHFLQYHLQDFLSPHHYSLKVLLILMDAVPFSLFGAWCINMVLLLLHYYWLIPEGIWLFLKKEKKINLRINLSPHLHGALHRSQELAF